MPRPIKLPYRDRIKNNKYRMFPSIKIKVYGLAMNIYSRNPDLIRFMDRKFSLIKHYQSAGNRYLLKDDEIDVVLAIKKNMPTIKELHAIDNDINGLISYAFSEKYAFFHASCVSSDKNCLFFAGPSMSGKTTMSFYLRKRGFSVLSDDDSIIRYDSCQVIPFQSFVNLRFKKNNPLPVRTGILHYLYHAGDMSFRHTHDWTIDLYGNGLRGKPEKRLNFIFIKGRRRRRPLLEYADKISPETLREFFRSVKTPQKERNKKISQVIDIYTKSSMYFLTMGAPAETADLIAGRFK